MIRSRPRRRPAVVVHRDEDGDVVLSTPEGIVRLSALEARELAADIARVTATLPPGPRRRGWPRALLRRPA